MPPNGLGRAYANSTMPAAIGLVNAGGPGRDGQGGSCEGPARSLAAVDGRTARGDEACTRGLQ